MGMFIAYNARLIYLWIAWRGTGNEYVRAYIYIYIYKQKCSNIITCASCGWRICILYSTYICVNVPQSTNMPGNVHADGIAISIRWRIDLNWNWGPHDVVTLSTPSTWRMQREFIFGVFVCTPCHLHMIEHTNVEISMKFKLQRIIRNMLMSLYGQWMQKHSFHII